MERIRRLAIPPAWTGVWISPLAEGHLQATGRDAKGRKQYRYHDLWREIRDASKFERLVRFAEALPQIREHAARDVSSRQLSREKVLGVAVLLLDRTLIRPGNEEYARSNDAYGLTTLRDHHLTVDGSELRFVFRGKGGKCHDVGVRDPRLARVIRRLQELPGEELFQYMGEDGPQPIGSADVNGYMRALAGDDFTAKDFRTWGGTVITAVQLSTMPPPASPTDGERNVNVAVDVAARHLGNTRAVAKRAYVHPAVIESYLANELNDLWPALVREALAGECHDWGGCLRPEEAALLRLLRRNEV